MMVRSTRVMLDGVDISELVGDWFDDYVTSPIITGGSQYRSLVIIMSVILILMTAVNIGKTLQIYSTSYSVSADSGSRLFRTILYQPMQFFEQFRSGELIQRLEDSSTLDLSLVRTIVPRLIDVLMTVVYFVLMILYNWKVALMCTAVEVLYFSVSMMFRNRIMMQARGRAVSTGNMNTSLLNGLSTIDTIKTGGFERLYFSGWKRTQEEAKTRVRHLKDSLIRLWNFCAIGVKVPYLFQIRYSLVS